jgi:hypothetical protein
MDSLQRARMPQGSCQTHPTSENMFLKSLKATPMRAIEAFSNYGSDHLLSAEPNAQFKPPAVDLIQGRLQLLPFRAEMPPEREYDWPLCAKLLSRVTTSTSKARPQRLDLKGSTSKARPRSISEISEANNIYLLHYGVRDVALLLHLA